MEKLAFKVGKKFTRGAEKGKTFTETVKVTSQEEMYKILWDAADAYENNKVNYIIEWYSPK